jgi:predicted nucleic acid-binding protein
MRQGEAVFVDSGAWIALASATDPFNASAHEQLDVLQAAGAKLHTSVPVVIETFTFLDRRTGRDVALTWKEAIYKEDVKILPCDLRDLQQSWEYFRRADLCTHETGANPGCLYVRPSLRGRWIQVGWIVIFVNPAP